MLPVFEPNVKEGRCLLAERGGGIPRRGLVLLTQSLKELSGPLLLCNLRILFAVKKRI